MLAGAAFAGLVTGIAAPQAYAQSTNAGGLEQIVVTAQRRAENLQQVPISVSAVTADTLQRVGINSTNLLPQIVPALQFTRSGASAQFFIRGIGTNNGAAGEEGANAVYIDGVYMGDLNQAINEFNNIERVEVLKGPQGTLFGRNAVGGLIHIITKDPGDKLTASGSLGYGTFQKVKGQLYVGGPLSETVSADLAITALNQNDGWGRNLTLNTRNRTQELWGVRSKFVIRPSDKLKVTLAGDYTKDDDDLSLGYHLPVSGFPGTGGNSGPSGYDTTQNFPGFTHLRIWGLSATAEANLGFADLTSITAMRQVRNASTVDVDGGPLNIINLDFVSRARAYSEELRLASNSTGPLSWQFGIFYLRSEARNAQIQKGLAFAPTLFGQFIQASLNTDSYAGFGEVTYAITPTTKLTGGVRYTKDSRHFDGRSTAILANQTFLPTSRNPSTSLAYDEPSFRATINQQINDDISAYASFNRSFKSGSYSLQAPLNAPVNPQFINAYEVGVKSEWFNRMLRLNVSGYHYDITDFQIRSAALATPGSSVLLNAATVKVDGVDVEFEAAPTDEVRIFGGFTVLNSRFSKFGGAGTALQGPIVYPNPATCPANGTANPGLLGPGPRTGGLTTCVGDLSGQKLFLSPSFTGNLGISYTTQLGSNGGELRTSVLYTYNSGYKLESDGVFRQPHYNILSASVEYRPTERYGIEVWGNNLTKAYYLVNSLSSGTGSTQLSGAPRTYGVNLKFDF